MKKLLSVLLCAVMVLSLAACGKNQQTFMDLTGNKSSYAANLTFTAARWS